MLDDTATIFQVQAKAIGRVLFEQVCKQINLLEADYFGLEYQDGSSSRNWLDLEKPLHRQVGFSLAEPILWFCVKFYTPDPSTQLEEEFTRYLFCLQIKRDLSQGYLQCNENTASLMASYIVQAECGDYVSEDYPDHTYLSSYKFVPRQDKELERKIMENHKKHAGQSPAAADLNLLETARRCELYGVKMHSAKDHEGIVLNLSVAHMGIVVFQNYTKINTFSWAKIRKISFKRKRFLIKLHPEGYGYYKDIVEFLFDNRNDCKNFWKKCVENHGFFRCSTVKNIPRQRTRVLSRGSSFRYSGKTQKQIVEFVRENYVKRQTFQRSQSFRNSNSLLSSSTVEGTISAQPLLPINIDSPNLAANSTGVSRSYETSMKSHSMTTTSNSSIKIYPTNLRKTKEAFDEIQPATEDLQSQSGGVTNTSQKPHPTDTTSTIRAKTTPTTMTTSSILPSAQHPPQHLETVDVHDTTTTGSDITSISSSIPPVAAQQSTLFGAMGSAAVGGTSPPGSHHLDTIGVQVESINNTSSSTRSLKNDSSSADSSPRKPQMNGVSPHYSNHILSSNNNNNELNRKNLERNQDTSPKVVIITNGAAAASPGNNTTPNSGNSTPQNNRLKRRYTADKSYFIIKELHMTERTFRKDLEVINLWFRGEVNKQDNNELLVDALDDLFNSVDPIYDANCSFLRDIELRLSSWENKAQQCIGDMLLKHFNSLHYFKTYMEQHYKILHSLDEAYHSNPKFEAMYKQFETQKVCYLPLTSFILKPLQRLIQYYQILDKLLNYYNKDYADYEDCFIAYQKLSNLIPSVTNMLRKSENLVQLCELDRDMNATDLRLNSDRSLIRLGCLAKFSQRRGYQQRMFLLFSDVLVYSARSGDVFKVHGQLPLKDVVIEERVDTPPQYSFIVYCGNRVITVAATSQEEKDKWLDDLTSAVQSCKLNGSQEVDDRLKYFSLKSSNSVDDVMEKCDDLRSAISPQRSNTTLHVCWHRNTSVSIDDHLRCMHNQLSGYLLRKFKNSNGWQKLFLVFTNFCLFFYKTFQDDCPLASLPLLGYTVSKPDEKDGIFKDFVFKLQFKNHIYFFRAESEYTFSRWMDVINASTQHRVENEDATVESCRL